MRQHTSQVKELQTYIELNNIERKSDIWQQVSESVIDNCPRVNEDQLRSLTCGVYQLKLSSSYIQEDMDGGSDIRPQRKPIVDSYKITKSTCFIE
jgi:hypothetical protein